MLTLYIGNKNYSSWSLRPWLLMRTLDIAFLEHQVLFNTEAFEQTLAKVTPTARVPVLVDDGFSVWDSLAIIEYLADKFPGKRIWPAEPEKRARARSICAEMHSGFAALRSQMPMNLEAHLPGRGWNLAVQTDIDRIVRIWSELLAQNVPPATHESPFLFGQFCAADAFFSPVVTRLQTHAVKLPADCERYCQAIRALPAMQQWTSDALAEQHFVAQDEPYRKKP